MSSSESEEENLHFYGKPLEPYEEDAIPKKRPISIEDQVARDAQGRRRFHGAFTGGFSAGFFNTVGSLEGWKPKEFKSSRAEKSESFAQKPQDFMDDEDFGEFGFAPQKIKATKEYAAQSANQKRKRFGPSDGPIPGVPVLHSLLQSNETIGYLLLRNMGIRDKEAELREVLQKNDDEFKSFQAKSDRMKHVECDPIYKEYLTNPKMNTFGLGYVGLQKVHIPTKSSGDLVLSNKEHNKKLTISGQAFGVGAFEEDDEDIYGKDDLSNYDFEMTTENNKQGSSSKAAIMSSQNLVLGNFVLSNELAVNEQFPPPSIPASFTGKYKQKKSRFEPLESEKAKEQHVNEQPVVKRKDMNSELRRKIWNDQPNSKCVDKKGQHGDTSDLKVPKDKDAEKEDGQGKVKNPFDALILDRFVAEGNSAEEEIHDAGTKEMQEAVRMKMFGPLTTVTISWQPCSLLCKRFNLPEPIYGETYSKPDKTHTRKNHLIFEYEKHLDKTPVLKAGLNDAPNEKNTVETTNDMVVDVASQEIEIPVRTDCIIANSTNQIGESIITPNKVTILENKIITVSNTEDNSDCSHSGVTPKNSDDKKKLDLQIDNNPPPPDITEKVNVEQNIDLFKAIFLSDNEDDSDGENTKGEGDEAQKQEEVEKLQETIMGDLIPTFRPTKEGGLLSNLKPGFHKFTKKSEKTDDAAIEHKDVNVEAESESEERSAPKPQINENIYGPKLPDKEEVITVNEKERLSFASDKNVITIEDENGDDNDDDESSESDAWIERDKVPAKKEKKPKKVKKKKKEKDNDKKKKNKRKKHKKDKRR